MPIVYQPHRMLSARQRELCDVVTRLTEARGFPPSCREIAAAMGVHFSRAAQLMKSTAAKGSVTFEPGVARSIRVIRPPEAKAKSVPST